MERALSGLRNNAKNLKVKNFQVVENYNPTFEGVGDEGVGLIFIQGYNIISSSTLSIYSIRWETTNAPDIEKALLHGNEIITGVSYDSGTITVTTNANNTLGLLVKFGTFKS